MYISYIPLRSTILINGDLFAESNKSADQLFQDVLRRKDRADATRNALGVLHRFRFLFNLPCTIDRNIKKVHFSFIYTRMEGGGASGTMLNIKP